MHMFVSNHFNSQLSQLFYQYYCMHQAIFRSWNIPYTTHHAIPSMILSSTLLEACGTSLVADLLWHQSSSNFNLPGHHSLDFVCSPCVVVPNSDLQIWDCESPQASSKKNKKTRNLYLLSLDDDLADPDESIKHDKAKEKTWPCGERLLGSAFCRTNMRYHVVTPWNLILWHVVGTVQQSFSRHPRTGRSCRWRVLWPPPQVLVHRSQCLKPSLQICNDVHATG